MARKDAPDDPLVAVARYQIDRLVREDRAVNVPRSGARQPGAPQPDATHPDRPHPDGPQPDRPQLAVPQPAMIQPAMPQLAAPQPAMPQPAVSQPPVPQPGATQPDATQPDNAGQSTMEQRAHYVEIAIGQAIRRGDFDDLPGAGKPLDLPTTHDPDWWIRRKIEREKLTGLGPPALTLRTENSQLDERIDASGSERQVRELLDDFNRRVIDARRQLQGGPPVVTPTRDVNEQVERWRERRMARIEAFEQERQRDAAEHAAMTWRQRRAVRRASRG